MTDLKNDSLVEFNECSDKLVISYQFTDGATYWGDVNQPVEYKSAEDFIVDFEKALKSLPKNEYKFEIAGKEFESFNFISDGEVTLPSVLSLNDWFEENKP